MYRRTAVRTIGTATGGAVVGVAGCLFRDEGTGTDESEGDPEPDDPDHEGSLRIVTYRSMVTGTAPAGPRLEEAFTEAYPDAEIEWIVPEAGIEHYLRRAEHDAEIDADVCLGFTVGDLARIDDRVGDGGLLRELNIDRIDGSDRVRDAFAFDDPHGRALAYDGGHVALVYDETAVAPPESFAALLEAEYADALLAQHPALSMPGQAFLLWTIATGDPDDAMDYWADLTANGARIRESWTDAYGAYADGERPLVVSYATDPVAAATVDRDERRHRVAFPDGQGYALPEGMGIFEDAASVDLAYAFLEFVLSAETQAELARLNVQYPAVDGVDLDPAFDAVREPSESVGLGYTELRNAASDWLAAWTDRFDEQVVSEPEPPA